MSKTKISTVCKYLEEARREVKYAWDDYLISPSKRYQQRYEDALSYYNFFTKQVANMEAPNMARKVA